MRQLSSVMVALLLWLSSAGMAQQPGRHGAAPDHETATAPPAEDSDTASFARAIADQATEEQGTQFRAMIKSTETAQQQARTVARLGPNPDHSEELISKAATFQYSVDQALSDTGKFRESLSKSQQGTYRSPARKLAKSDAAVRKSEKNLSHHLEEIPPNPERVIAAISHLENALEELRSDQHGLGKAMAIPAR